MIAQKNPTTQSARQNPPGAPLSLHKFRFPRPPWPSLGPALPSSHHPSLSAPPEAAAAAAPSAQVAKAPRRSQRPRASSLGPPCSRGPHSSLASAQGTLGRPPPLGPFHFTQSLNGRVPLASPLQTLKTRTHFLPQWLLQEAESLSRDVLSRGSCLPGAHGRRDSRF